jgi:hypothetical protein
MEKSLIRFRERGEELSRHSGSNTPMLLDFVPAKVGSIQRSRDDDQEEIPFGS